MMFGKKEREAQWLAQTTLNEINAHTLQVKHELTTHRKETEIDVASAQTILGKLAAIEENQGKLLAAIHEQAERVNQVTANRCDSLHQSFLETRRDFQTLEASVRGGHDGVCNELARLATTIADNSQSLHKHVEKAHRRTVHQVALQLHGVGIHQCSVAFVDSKNNIVTPPKLDKPKRRRPARKAGR